MTDRPTGRDVPTDAADLLAARAAAGRYRRAFLVSLGAALVLALVLALGLGVLWWRQPVPRRARAAPATAPAAAKTGRTTEAGAAPAPAAGAAAPPEAEPPRAPIQLSPQRLQSIGVQTGIVESKVVRDELRLYGNVQAEERRLAYVQTRFAGWLRKVYADATGTLVRRGQPLFTIYSPELVATEEEYLLAKKHQALLRTSPVDGVAAGADSLLAAARQRLLQWEVPPRQIARLDATGKAIADVTIDSPVSGYITEKNALPNLYVQPETRLYAVADLSEVWVDARLFQQDAGRVAAGDAAEVTVDAYPGKVFRGRVDGLLPQVDMTTRTLPVRLVLPNPGLRLRPGMFVNVALELALGRQLVIPAAAALHSGTTTLAFVYGGDGAIEPRQVELGPRAGDAVVVRKGLRAGERIVTSPSFLIDSEAQLAAAAGAFVPPPPGAGAAAAMNAPPRALATAELTTEPSPPAKGANLVLVKLTGQDGKPIAGAEVTVTFFMAAMPAMGMAAMKTVVAAGEKGAGIYEGKGELASGGTWQVTVLARLHGQVVARRQLSLSATGGM
ncbi:MAG TPA: efflux RND transporter periplasmic adaptor subunit [Thermoanaerobaculia bacterium]|jgi:Cu(I)/Ag(I) efflux system membrane fusion protein/cobalt-zinc-cadmium efflux system membrane fusion protein|nr:efflux RND transporter periplasmic adaptor subunit [Thermoanaerobaculia bacterium]